MISGVSDIQTNRIGEGGVPVPRLLQNPRHRYARRSSSVDFQERFRDSIRSTDRNQPERAIVLLTRASDHDVDRLSLDLWNTETPLYRIDVDRCVDRSLCVDLSNQTLLLDGHLISPKVVWRRHASTTALLSPSTSQSYVDQQYPPVFDYLSRFPGAAQLNPASWTVDLNRVTQLEIADCSGMSTPRTCLSTDPLWARKTLETDDIIVKAMGDHFIEEPPTVVNSVFARRLAAHDNDPEPVPLLFQERIGSGIEWRIYWIDGQVVGYRVRREDAAALWMNDETVTVEPVSEVAELVEAQVRRFASSAGLGFGAFDFLESNRGLLFLEVNPDGDWAWFESKAHDERVSTLTREMLTRWLTDQ